MGLITCTSVKGVKRQPLPKATPKTYSSSTLGTAPADADWSVVNEPSANADTVKLELNKLHTDAMWEADYYQIEVDGVVSDVPWGTYVKTQDYMSRTVQASQFKTQNVRLRYIRRPKTMIRVNNAGLFADGNVITGATSGSTATVVETNNGDDYIIVKDASGQFITGENLLVSAVVVDNILPRSSVSRFNMVRVDNSSYDYQVGDIVTGVSSGESDRVGKVDYISGSAAGGDLSVRIWCDANFTGGESLEVNSVAAGVASNWGLHALSDEYTLTLDGVDQSPSPWSNTKVVTTTQAPATVTLTKEGTQTVWEGSVVRIKAIPEGFSCGHNFGVLTFEWGSNQSYTLDKLSNRHLLGTNAHAQRTPIFGTFVATSVGTMTITCTVFDDITGTITATGTIDITVVSKDSVFGSPVTIGSDVSDDHATFAEAEAALGGTSNVWLQLRGGENHIMSGWTVADNFHMEPIPSTGTPTFTNAVATNGDNAEHIVISGLSCDQGYSASSFLAQPKPSHGVAFNSVNEELVCSVIDCNLIGCAQSISAPSRGFTYIVNNSIQHWADYGVFSGDSGAFTLLGNLILQAENSPQDTGPSHKNDWNIFPGSLPDHGPQRASRPNGPFVAELNEIGSNNSWDAGWTTVQPVLRPGQGVVPDLFVYMVRNTLYGDTFPAGFRSGGNGSPFVPTFSGSIGNWFHNIRSDNAIIEVNTGERVVKNNVLVVGSSKVIASKQNDGNIRVGPEGDAYTNSQNVDIMNGLNMPVYIYHNSMIDLRTDDETIGTNGKLQTFVYTWPNSAFAMPNAYVDDNTLYMPNRTGWTTDPEYVDVTPINTTPRSVTGYQLAGLIVVGGEEWTFDNGSFTSGIPFDGSGEAVTLSPSGASVSIIQCDRPQTGDWATNDATGSIRFYVNSGTPAANDTLTDGEGNTLDLVAQTLTPNSALPEFTPGTEQYGTFQPQTGSGALDAATGRWTPKEDIFMTTRPGMAGVSGTPAMGAMEVE